MSKSLEQLDFEMRVIKTMQHLMNFASDQRTRLVSGQPPMPLEVVREKAKTLLADVDGLTE